MLDINGNINMKLKIKVKELTEGCMPEIIEKGDWIDLKAAEDVEIHQPYANILHKTTKGAYRDVEINSALIPLGIAMQFPKGFEGYLLPRSSSYKNYGFIVTNSKGIIDQTYCGDHDEWKLPIVSLKPTTIHKGDRVAQFRVQLSQKATLWQKIKWLLSSGVKLVKVDNLGNNNRGMNVTGVN